MRSTTRILAGGGLRGGVRCCALVVVLIYATQANCQNLRFTYDSSGNQTTRMLPDAGAPRILVQPSFQIVGPGEIASFSVLVADTRGLAYQWRFNGADLPGRTNDTLLLLNVNTNEEGSYDVLVTNIAGRATSQAAQLYIDSDRDGLPDSWELAYFGNLTSQRSDGDADGDNVSNLKEFFEGTNPTNKLSARQILKVTADGGAVMVEPFKTDYDLGEVVTLMATPFPPNLFHGWTGDTNTDTNPLALVMNTNTTIQARFISATTPPGIIGWWRAENDALDSAGTNQGTLQDGATFASGKAGRAFSFNGISQSVDIPDSPDLRPSSLTIECWVQFNSPAGTQVFFAKPVGASIADSFALWLQNGSLYGVVGNASGSGPTVGIAFSPVPGTWYHVAFTFDDRTRRQVLYLNGAVVASGFGNRAVGYDSHPMLFGRDDDNGGPAVFFGGLIDEPALYNRALTAAEVAEIYRADAAGKEIAKPVFESQPYLPYGVVGKAYSQQFETILGAAPIAFAFSAGSTPAGLTLASSGLLSGIPTSAGSNTFAVLATDALGSSSELVCTLNILPKDVPVISGGLIAWWRAEDDTLDSIGTNHGVLLGDTTYAPGRVGSAFSLDGVGDSVAIPNSSWMNASGPFSVEAWIKASLQQFSSDQYFLVVDKSHGCGDGTGWVLLGVPNGAMEFAFGKGGSPAAGNFPNVVGTSSVLDDQWHHIVGVYSGTQLALYQDGLLANAVAVSDVPAPNSRDVEIGRWCNSPDRAYHGLIDEVSIYNRALTPAEVASLYNAGSAGKVVTGPYIDTPPLPVAFVGQGYTQQLASARAQGSLTYALTAGALPTGLTLASTGLLSGVPTGPGTFDFTVQATDATSLANTQTFSIQVYSPVSPPAGLVGWWQAESNALDSVGTNHGVLKNGTSFAQGESGRAFFLSGASQSVEIPDAPELRPPSVTVECWVLCNAANGLRVIAAKPLGSGFLDSYTIWIDSGVLKGQICDTNGLAPTLSAPFPSLPGTWHHVAFTFDDGNKWQALYLDGVAVSSGAVNRSIGYDNQPLLWGRDTENGNPNYFFAGRIDEAALYNRALSAAEIESLFNAGPAGKAVSSPYFSTPPVLPVAVMGQPYTQPLATTRSTPPVSYSLVQGSLPEGIDLSAGGVLRGTPANPGTFNFTLRASDTTGLSGEQAFILTVAPRVPPPSSLISWWRAENDGADAAGPNPGALTNGAGFAPGLVGQSFSLDGVDDAFEIQDAPSLHPASLTLEAWVLFFSPSATQVIFSKGIGTGTAQSFLLWFGKGGLNGEVTDSAGATTPISAAFVPVLGRWYHVAFTFDETTRQQTLYVDGSPVSGGISNRLIGYDDHPMLLGADIETGVLAYPLSGRIDEAAIYGRALSPAEIASLYYAGPSGKAATGPYFGTAPVLPDAALGQGYTQALTSVRGTAPVAFSIVDGALPAGLVLDPAGAIMGSSSDANDFAFIVRATDASGLYADQAFTMRVVAPTIPPSGLVSWWRAEDDARDSAGPNHGVLTNGAAFGAGKVGRAFSLDGTNDYINVPDSPSLRLGSLTLEAWVSFFNTTGIRALLSKPVGGGISDSYQIYLSGGNLAGVVGDAGGVSVAVSVPFTPVLGRWYYVAFTFDDSTMQQVLYLDGVTVASGTASKHIAYDSHPFLLGCDVDNGNRAYFFQGLMDEVAIYDRAISAEEVIAVYDSGSAGKLKPVLTPPALQVLLTSTNSVVVFWPAASTGFNLQQNDDLTTTNWSSPLEHIRDDGTNKFIVIDAPLAGRYFRLASP